MPTVACSLAELYGELEFTYAASLTRLWDATKMDTEIRQSFGHDGPPEEELRHSPSTALHAAAACVGYSKQQHAQIVAEAAMGCDVQPTGGAGRSPPRHAAVPEPGFGYTHRALKVGTGGTWPGVFQKILSLCGRAGVHFAQKEGDVLARSDRPIPAADRLPLQHRECRPGTLRSVSGRLAMRTGKRSRSVCVSLRPCGYSNRRCVQVEFVEGLHRCACPCHALGSAAAAGPPVALAPTVRLNGLLSAALG